MAAEIELSARGTRRKKLALPCFRLAVLLLVSLALLVTGVRAQSSFRAKAIGQRLMCVCGCNQVLTACNHVGCSYSHAMLKELDERVARGESDDLILQDFVQEYGPTVLVDPPKRGFTSLVWIAPIVAPLLAFFLIWELARRWRQRGTLAAAGEAKISPGLLARARQEFDKESHE